jgi:hypothetical protein
MEEYMVYSMIFFAFIFVFSDMNGMEKQRTKGMSGWLWERLRLPRVPQRSYGPSVPETIYIKEAPAEVQTFVVDAVTHDPSVIAHITNDPNKLASAYATDDGVGHIIYHSQVADAIISKRTSQLQKSEFDTQTAHMNFNEQFAHLRNTISVKEAQAIGMHEHAHIQYEHSKKVDDTIEKMKLNVISQEEYFKMRRAYECEADQYVYDKGSPRTKEALATFLDKACIVERKHTYNNGLFATHPCACERAQQARNMVHTHNQDS